MKSAVETLSPTRAKLTVEVPFEVLKPSLDAAYKQIAKQSGRALQRLTGNLRTLSPRFRWA